VTTTFLVAHPWLTTLVFWTLVVVGPVAGSWLVDRRRATLVLALVSVLGVLALTMGPSTPRDTVTCAQEWSLPTFGAVELVANVVLFVPPVLLLGVALRRPLAVALVASVGSAALEAIQALAPVLGRACSTDDWLSNTLGAALGAVLAAIALRLHHRVPHERPSGTARNPEARERTRQR